MNITTEGFLLLNLSGIDLFLKMVDQMVAAGLHDGSYEVCAKSLQGKLHAYGKSVDEFNKAPVAAALPEPLTMPMDVLLDRHTCNDKRYLALRSNIVYVIRDGNSPLYVGSTRYDARSRIKSHQKAHSLLGKALRAGKIENWSVEMIPHAEYREASLKEKRLISELHPRFNLKY